MKKIIITLFLVVLLLSAVGCSQTPPDEPYSTDISTENNQPAEPLLNNAGSSGSNGDDSDNNYDDNSNNNGSNDSGDNYNGSSDINDSDDNNSDDNYDEFSADVYLCDDVYRTDDTPTHGSGSIALPMTQDVLKIADYQLLLCDDGCEPSDVVSRASQGYAPVYQVVSDGELEGNYHIFRFKMVLPEQMAEDLKNQGDYEYITEQLESSYYYLLVLDANHYAYIHLARNEGAEKIERETEFSDSIVKDAKISFES